MIRVSEFGNDMKRDIANMFENEVAIEVKVTHQHLSKHDVIPDVSSRQTFPLPAIRLAEIRLDIVTWRAEFRP
jgi:hypothetical protein